MNQRRCTKCSIHGEESAHKSEECKWKHCGCRKCQLIGLQRKVENKVKRQGRKRVCTTSYVCSRCRHHGIITVKKYHAPCPFVFCKCEKCELFNEKKIIESALIIERQRDMRIDIVRVPPENQGIKELTANQTGQVIVSPEAKVILQLLVALASYPNTNAPANLDYDALNNLLENPLISLPENWNAHLPEIFDLVHTALKRFQLIS